MMTRLGSILDTNLTFDVRVTEKNEHLTEHYKVHVFDLLVYSAAQQSDDFILLAAVLLAGTHLPGPSDADDTMTAVTCNQQRTKS